MDKNLALEFVRVTEATAMAAAAYMGKGDKLAADKAAVDAMRSRFNSIDFEGIVKIGEGEKDEAPQLYTDEKIGTGNGPKMDVALDPIEGTTNLAYGRPNSIAVVATGARNMLLKVPGTYMDQLVVGAESKGKIDIKRPIKENIHAVAAALGKPVHDVVVAILDRPRHAELIKQIRSSGARIYLIDHGTVAAGVACGLPDSGVDIMAGTGGAPEAIITAVGIKCLGGDMQAILKPHEDKFVRDAKAMGFDDLDRAFTLEELAGGENCTFAATGITSGPLLRGVTIRGDILTTHSLVMRSKTRTVRFLETWHRTG